MKVRLFDVAVLGHGIGGLVAALILQKRGTKVVVLSTKKERSFDPSGCEFLNGFTLKPMLKRIGFHPTEVNAIPALEVPVQLIFEHHRIDCYGDEKRFERELQREFPRQSKQILELFRESFGHLEVYQHLFNSRVPLPPTGFFAKRQFSKVLKSICDESLMKSRLLSDELRSFEIGDDFGRAIGTSELCLTGLVSPWTTGAQLGHLLTLVRWEGYGAAEGPSSLKEMILAKLKEHGVIVADADQLEEVRIQGKRIQGYRVTGTEWDDIEARATIVAGEPRGLISAAEGERPLRKWASELSKLAVHSRKAYQVLKVAPQGVPVGLQPQGAIVPPAAPAGIEERRRRFRALRFVVRRGNGSDPVRIGLTAFLPPDGDRPDSQTLQREIYETLKTVIPFLDQHISGEPSPLYIPSLKGELGDFRQGLVYTTDYPRMLGVCGLSPKTPFSNVFQASEVVFPGLGLDGEVIAGHQAAQFVSELLSSPKSKI